MHKIHSPLIKVLKFELWGMKQNPVKEPFPVNVYDVRIQISWNPNMGIEHWVGSKNT